MNHHFTSQLAVICHTILNQHPRPEGINLMCRFYCQNNQSHQCSMVVYLASQKQVLSRMGWCFLCLWRGHLGRDCRYRSYWASCLGRYQWSICDRPSCVQEVPQPSAGQSCNYSQRHEGNIQIPILASSIDSDLHLGTNTFVPEQTTITTVCSNSPQAIFLQTTRTILCNPDSSTSLKVCLLLDCDSQKSYISQCAFDLLALNPHGTNIHYRYAFGTRTSSKRVCSAVNFCLLLQDHSHNEASHITMYVVPTICKLLVGHPVSACQKIHLHLLGLKLADTFSSTNATLPVDVLIGTDAYWDLATGLVCQECEGATTVHTKLGWVLSGPSHSASPHMSTTNLITHALTAHWHHLG